LRLARTAVTLMGVPDTLSDGQQRRAAGQPGPRPQRAPRYGRFPLP